MAPVNMLIIMNPTVNAIALFIFIVTIVQLIVMECYSQWRVMWHRACRDHQCCESNSVARMSLLLVCYVAEQGHCGSDHTGYCNRNVTRIRGMTKWSPSPLELGRAPHRTDSRFLAIYPLDIPKPRKCTQTCRANEACQFDLLLCTADGTGLDPPTFDVAPAETQLQLRQSIFWFLCP